MNEPHIICSTARDFTTRLYDLSLEARQKPNNPHWAEPGVPGLAGPAHGLMMNEPEGIGKGLCVAVFVGNRSGGHEAAVLSAVSCGTPTGGPCETLNAH